MSYSCVMRNLQWKAFNDCIWNKHIGCNWWSTGLGKQCINRIITRANAFEFMNFVKPDDGSIPENYESKLE